MFVFFRGFRGQKVNMKLLLIGSASVHTHRYLAGIAPHVAEVHLASNGPLPPRYQVPNLGRVLAVDFSLKALGTAARLARLIDEVQPDIVHVHQANSVAWHARRALAGRKLPWVLTTWGSDVLLLPQQNALMKKMVAANLAAASAVTSDSLHMAAVCRQLASVARMDVLNFGMDALPPPPDIAAKPLSVLSCRLHKPLYRIDAILRAWAEVEADAPALEIGWVLGGLLEVALNQGDVHLRAIGRGERLERRRQVRGDLPADRVSHWTPPGARACPPPARP